MLFCRFLFVIGQSGYHANLIQFGLDQLLEAPSEYLGLFIHWATWAYSLIFAVLIIPCVLLTCYYRYDSVPSKVFMSVARNICHRYNKLLFAIDCKYSKTPLVLH